MLLAAVPFAFGGIRFLTTGHDLRYVWMAVASALCAGAVLVRPGSPAVARRARMVVAAVASASGATVTAILLGATAAAGIAIVAVAFGLCSASGMGLVVRSRVSAPSRPQPLP